MKQKVYILPIIIISQFACTSLWFAGNAIIDELVLKIGAGMGLLGYVLSAVQFGFITGTLVFALLMIADRFSPSRVFGICAFLAACCNGLLILDNIAIWELLISRFGTGFFLAGIYPVGMKIAADYYEKGLGKALGFLVGALVIGAAFPYLVNSTSWGKDPNSIIITTTAISILGGTALWLFVPNGPYRKPSARLRLNASKKLFQIKGFQKAAFGYFGHMWELYAFWAFTPIAIKAYNVLTNNDMSVPLWTGIIIALGSISCVLGGYMSEKIGSYKVAKGALLISGISCLFSPLFFQLAPFLFIGVWCLWGMAVTADSPQFSNLVASSIPPELKGTGLTLVNCMGFAISIVSIQLTSFLSGTMQSIFIFTFLAIGPLWGVWKLRKYKLD